jgi:hypothetical protein
MARDVRLYVLLARESPAAVVFRRGPTKQVLLLSWDTATDRFEEGQWLKGRIYERRCDLSPAGDLLLYFAANWKLPYQSWTAISRPPFLSALALWPKGDAWGGGGQFVTRDEIALNHRPAEMALAEGFAVPKSMRVGPMGDASGWGEDNPVWDLRLVRDGWIHNSAGQVAREEPGARVWIGFDPPAVWEKPHRGHTLRMTIYGIHERTGPWYVIEHDVVSEDGAVHALGRADWADWSFAGDLLFARNGILYRASAGDLANPRAIVDLSELSFTARRAPAEAMRWPRR